MASKLFRAVILGAPASGKGTISGRIVNRFNIEHVSSGDMLRVHVRDGTALGEEANNYIRQGLLVPDDVIIKMVLRELEKKSQSNWLLDGMPRTRLQAEHLYKYNPLDLAVNLAVPFDVIISRVKNRWIHVPSGRVYNLNFNAPKVPGKDDVTGEDLEQRPDDNPEAVRKRLEIYSQNIESVLKYYKDLGILREFDGNTSDEIWPKVKVCLEQFVSAR